MGKLSSTQRTNRHLKEQGRISAIVEKWNPHVGPHGIRQDLFGIIDVLCLDPVKGVVGVQCCAGSGYSAHRRKITEERAQETHDWLSTKVRCPNCFAEVQATQLEIWGWRKLLKKRGGRARIWTPRIETITLDDIK